MPSIIPIALEGSEREEAISWDKRRWLDLILLSKRWCVEPRRLRAVGADEEKRWSKRGASDEWLVTAVGIGT